MKRKFLRRLMVIPVLSFILLYVLVILKLIENGSSECEENDIGNDVHFIPSNAGLMPSAFGRSSSNHDQTTNITMKTKRTIFTKMTFGPVYVLGAAAGNTSTDVPWDIYKVYANVNMTGYDIKNFRCCLLYQRNGETEFVMKTPLRYSIHRKGCFLMPIHITCPNIKHELGEKPVGIGLTMANLSCDARHVTYVTPYYPLKQPETKLAVSTKIAYGNINAELIIEWMETYKFLGVDKVITYYLDSINQDALKVLKFYESTGILDLYQHESATEAEYPRHFDTASAQRWCDQLMAVYDSFEKMFGYTYFGIIDHDEFLIPSNDRTIKEMLADLYASHDADAAGFTFQSQFYHTSWGPSGNVNDLILGSYINRTASGPEDDHSKDLYRPTSIRPGSVRTLYTKPLKGKKMYMTSSEEGFIRHFRECREETRSKCLFVTERVTDPSVAQWSMRILNNVHKARENIFGTLHYSHDLLKQPY